MSKLDTLYREFGCENEDDFLSQYAMEDTVPAICMSKDCDYTAEYEPDQDQGWCEVCEKNTVKSGLVLLGVI